MSEVDEKKTKTTTRDPRTHVTPDAFGVADDLLGRELATPWRRGVALLLDLVVVFALTQAGGLAFAVLLSLTVFWFIVRGAKGWKSAFLRGNVALVAALFVFVLTLPFVVEIEGYGPSMGQWQEFGEAMGSDDPVLREAALRDLEESYENSFQHFDEMGEGVPGTDLSDLSGLFDSDDENVIDATKLAELPPEEAADAADSLDAFSAALRAGDVEALESRRGDVTPWLVGDELARRDELRRELVRGYAKVTRENQELRSRLDEPSLAYLVQAVAGDLGLTIGWTGLYFTLVPAFWRGRTVGKFLLRLRIVRLDLSPVRPWTAFERFAGYAAGLATGLLGFLQIFWDANRQGVQDKIVGTVVVRER